MIKRFCFLYAFLCLLSCRGQDHRTKEQREAGYPEPIVWDDPNAKSILDSVAAPRLVTDTIQLRQDLVKLLSFVNNERRRESIPFFSAWMELDENGVVAIREMSGSPAIESQLVERMGTLVGLLKFEPAYMLKEPGKKVPFTLIYLYTLKRMWRGLIWKATEV